MGEETHYERLNDAERKGFHTLADGLGRFTCEGNSPLVERFAAELLGLTGATSSMPLREFDPELGDYSLDDFDTEDWFACLHRAANGSPELSYPYEPTDE